MFGSITHLLDQFGYAGIALLMFLENVFPPIPSELIMPLAGFDAARGDMNIVLVILSGSIGSLVGASLWYFLGRWIGEDRLKRWAGRHGRLLTLNASDIDKVNTWFDRHNEKAVLMGRLVPAVRTLISVPAGLFEMRLDRFLLFSSLGTAAWTALLTAAGYLLGEQYKAVQGYLNPVSNIVVGAFVAFYLFRVVTWKPL
ncbi:DedA family protein [Novosphingobium pentaromativorans]|uniref:DedA family protein n=1 Tax=Novosphingobium pentaromativorans US6-1 TaxID=1088721 RepID=G6EDJ6_9SPHN|nr:DedA family protein [Novosphingobium pentaromativorans]AIT79728.1 alkaline phosphatase [Novosphingobium pentaromativorans US6-1]EHJ60624.1 DedA family protein [Novosphingobium pentaromativorans US6-1]